jgi:hypothetical protein
MQMSDESYQGWSILELMGHRRLGGFAREVEIAGASFIQIDVPDDGGPPMTQLYSPNAVY